MLHGINPNVPSAGERPGKGIKELKSILDGGYSSATGMGLGLIGTRRLMDELRSRLTRRNHHHVWQEIAARRAFAG